MEQFKCPSCGGLQETLEVEMEIVGSQNTMMPSETGQELIDNASVGIEANCEFCSYSGDPDNFDVVEELTEEEQNEKDNRPLKGQYDFVLNFGDEFE